MNQFPFIDLPDYQRLDADTMRHRAKEFYDELKRRRTVREYSTDPVPIDVIERCIQAAGTAPNGANLQPWHFVIVQDPEIKRQIRLAAEKEEREFYNGKAPQEWIDALQPLGTDENKPFLEDAPYLIVVFSQTHLVKNDGSTVKHYYATESVGIATGMLITALHHCGLASLTHTPSPMKFLNQILDRPSYERPFLILVTGFAAEDARVPDITKKPLSEIVTVA